MTAPNLTATRTFLISVISMVMACGLISLESTLAQQKSGAIHRNNPSRDLRKVGETVAKAVLDKDIPALLTYDRADLRPADEVSLKNTKSDLYCYIFDSDCITWGSGNWRSVYDKLSQAHQLEIKVSVSSSPYDRQLYGSLFFYDAAAVSAKDLRSRDYLCKEGPANITSWKFRLENGKWKPVTPLFDSETRACPTEVQGDDQ
ncbi:MAG: hypothetical protein JWO71_3549 [Candidatus Acidoferrum typicum]|nr:hypothetical protein [Candidatus Acidoferrum typicum]